MLNKTEKWLWIGVIVVVVLGAVWQFYPLPDAHLRVNSLPFINPNHYRGENVPLTPFEQQFFSEINPIKRIYYVGNQILLITILDGTHNRHVVHDPYYCFKGDGWMIERAQTIDIPHGQAEFLKIKKGNKRKEALFWFSDGRHNFASTYKYWAETTWRRLTLGRSGEEPVLIMIQSMTDAALDLKNIEAQMPELFEI